MIRHFQTVAFWLLLILSACIPFALIIVVVFLDTVPFWSERPEPPLFWRLWHVLLIFLIPGVSWWALIAWMRRTDRQISN
jgi:hypothetical protein